MRSTRLTSKFDRAFLPWKVHGVHGSCPDCEGLQSCMRRTEHRLRHCGPHFQSMRYCVSESRDAWARHCIGERDQLLMRSDKLTGADKVCKNVSS